MISFLVWATAYLATGGFCAQVCYGKAKGSCNRCSDSYSSCDHAAWYFAVFLGFFMPMIMAGVILAKKSKLDVSEKERFERRLQEARWETELAEEAARTSAAELTRRVAEVKGLNKLLEEATPGAFSPIPTSDLR